MLPQSFYDRPTLKVAQDLLGCFLVRKIGKKIIKVKIVETEAYVGHKDKASHASRGRTARNEIMFGAPGTIYVYFTYGMHHMLNIVTEKKEYPAAVLIRAVEVIRRDAPWRVCTKPWRVSTKPWRVSTNGPAKLTKALKIDKSFNTLPVYVKKYGLWIEGRREIIKLKQIKKAKRVGVDYAEEYKDKLWRFYIKGNSFVSKK